MYKHIVVCLALMGLLATGADAQARLTLAQAIKKGLRNNFQIQIAEKNREVAENNNSWEAAGRYPNINFNIFSRNAFNYDDNPAGFISDPYTSTNFGLTGNIDLLWTIFDGHRVKINKQRLEELERQSNSSIDVEVERGIQSIILAYYQALIEKERLDVLQEALDLSIDRVEYQEIRQKYGQAGAYEILQSKDALLNDSTSILVQMNTFDTALRNLNLAMGERNPAKKYVLTDSLAHEAENYEFRTLQQKMLASNKQLKNLDFSLKLAQIDSRLQESFKKPTLSVNSGLNQSFNVNRLNASNPFTGESFGSNQVRNSNFYLNLTASILLYDGGTRNRNIQNARLQESIAKLNIEELKQQLSSQLKVTLDTYDNQRKLLGITENLITNARQNLNISRERFRAGQINSFDYRTVQLAYINASQSRLNAIFNLKNTETELIRLIGGLVR
ncbi:MAG: TolC family protein [Bacteroidota bacterium]